jgi:hypothetical protein
MHLTYNKKMVHTKLLRACVIYVHTKFGMPCWNVAAVIIIIRETKNILFVQPLYCFKVYKTVTLAKVA